VNPWLGALVVALALALSMGGGWITTRVVLHLASRSSDAGGTTNQPSAAASPTTPPAEDVDTPPTGGEPASESPPASDGPEGPGALAALRGGTWIGLLERLATTGALMLGEPTAIAVVVAVKGLGRYPELREYPAASERFVVGSLASLVWAAGVGFLGRWLLTR
jgi:hypothetical protein